MTIMLTRPFLDPRHFRMDDLLRRPYTADAHFGSSGPNLSAVHPDGWGYANAVRWNDSAEFGLFTLTIRADGTHIAPANAISRPSHLTLHGVSDDGVVQVTEDKFITGRDVAVSVVSVRNAGRYDADVRIGLTWHLGEGEQTQGNASFYVLREAPPGDDLHLGLPAESHRILTFLTALAPDRDAARRAAWSVFDAEEAAFPRRSAHYVLPDANPLMSQVRSYQKLFDNHAPRFDCPDPWLTKLWYHGLHQQRRQNTSPYEPGHLLGLSSADMTALTQAQFANANFDQPQFDAMAARWPDVIVSEVLGITVRGEEVEVRPSEIVAAWTYFCLEDYRTSGAHRLTLVWDDPAAAVDAYDDGDKGLTLYRNGEPIYHTATLTPFAVDLASSAIR